MEILKRRSLFLQKKNITIPIKKEEVGEVKKTPYVKEEVVVKKKPVTETKEVTEDITHEEIEYDNQSNIDKKG